MIGCRPLNHDEKKRLNIAIKDKKRDRLLIMLGLATGFRISELLSLRIKDLVAPNKKPLDFVSVQAKNAKSKKGRSQQMNDQVQTAIKEWCGNLLKKGADQDSFVFVGRESKKFKKALTRQRAWQILKDIFAIAGIYGQTGTHTLRKTFAKGLKDSGFAIEVIQKALGHISITSTIHYLSFDQERLNNHIRNMELF